MHRTLVARAFLLILPVIAGCSLSNVLKNKCQSSDDCNPGNICHSGVCIAPSAIDMGCSGGSCGCTPESCAASGQRCEATSGRCAACQPPPAPIDSRSDIYVGSDTSSVMGSLPYCPYASITAALRAVTGASQAVTIHIAAGTYDNAKETFPLTVRGAVSLVGAGQGKTIINGTGAVTLTAGSAINWAFNTTLQLGDTTKQVSLSHLTITPGPATAVIKNTVGIYCDRGDSPTATAPNTLLSDLDIGPYYDGGLVTSNSDDSACNMSLTGSRIHDCTRGDWVIGCAVHPGVFRYVSASLSANTFSAIKGSDDPGIAIAVWDCTQTLSVVGNTFIDSGVGLSSGSHGRSPGMVISENTFSNLTCAGVDVDHNGNIVELLNNNFTGIQGASASNCVAPAALTLSASTQVILARGNRFIGNNIGVYISGQPLSNTRLMDFGSDLSAGNNVFSCNHKILGMHGYNVWLDLAAGTSDALQMIGNQWDHATPTTGSSVMTAPDGTDVLNTSATPVQVLTTGSSAVPQGACQ